MAAGNPADGKPPGRQDETPGGFLSRWSQRKALVRQGLVPVDPVLTAAPVSTAHAAVQTPDSTQLPAAPSLEPPAAPPLKPPTGPSSAPAPTLADVAELTSSSDYSRFVAPGVDVGVKNAALKKLFTAPHFNIMDGLDTYIDDYGKPDPLPAGMLRQMAQAHALGLFSSEDDDDAAAVARASVVAPTAAVDATAAAAALAPPPDRLPEPTPTPDENPDLRLQPHHAAGPAGTAAGPGPDTGRQHGRAG